MGSWVPSAVSSVTIPTVAAPISRTIADIRPHLEDRSAEPVRDPLERQSTRSRAQGGLRRMGTSQTTVTQPIQTFETA
jgi:hypothetical protein